MYEIGLHVPVVPVVTKADTMTIREAGMYRTEVANKIANPMLPGEQDGEIRAGPGLRLGITDSSIMLGHSLVPVVVFVAFC